MEHKRYNTPYTAKEKYRALMCLNNASFEFVAHRYHCTVQTLYRWRRAFDGTVQSLENRSSKPLTPHPNRHTESEIESIQRLIRRNPHIGLNELFGKLRLHYAYQRTPGGLYRFLRKHGYYVDVKKLKQHVPKKYDTPERMGVKWQLDVKHVPVQCCAPCIAGEKYYQYTVIDEATRERFIYPYHECSTYSTVDFVVRAIRFFRYKPQILQTDNGTEFTHTRQTKDDRPHPLDVLCARAKIRHVLIKPRTPRHNGKVERSHRADVERFYSRLKFFSYDDLKKQMQAYLERANSIPMSVLYPVGGKKSHWQSPNQKRAELLLLHHGITE